MDNQNIQDILKAHGIRKTLFRTELLDIFIKSRYGLSFSDIKSKVTQTQDKVTIYRGLDVFLEKGLIHKVPSNDRVAKYALHSLEEVHNRAHVHFICTECDNTFCLNEIEIPEIKDMPGYKIQKSKLTLEGNCPDCI
ncbi:MAG: transcriptional repressor [Bacteroidota bacterium]